MDDGWFGKRNCDNCSLGDWVVNREKLPDGLDGLSKRIHDLGMLFGLWMEPEMISPDSDLFRAHPDWCLHVKGRPSTLERSQLILDLSRAEVQDYVIEAVCRVLRESNADYLKWDMNRNIFARIAALLLTAHTAQTAASRLDRKRKYARSVILFTSPLLALTAGIQKLGSRLSNRQSFMNVCM